VTEQAALLAAVAANPDDDTVRLAYADWLDEHDEHDRAEFIRVQYELGKWTCNFKQTKEQPGWFHDCGTDDRGYWLCQPLRMRNGELLATHPEWSRARCPKCEGCGYVTGSADECPTCGGTGGLLGTQTVNGGTVDGRLPLRWRCGFIDAVEVPTLREVWDRRCRICGSTPSEAGERGGGCSRCDGGQVRDSGPTPWVAAVCRVVDTLTRIVPLDVLPYHNAAGCWLWLAASVNAPFDAGSVLPQPVFAELAGDIDSINRSSWRTYPTPAAATDALGLALCRLARGG
jgi:uncharacterized protein (TIGR02996 family)